jgi:hypothetical protein
VAIYRADLSGASMCGAIGATGREPRVATLEKASLARNRKSSAVIASAAT